MARPEVSKVFTPPESSSWASSRASMGAIERIGLYSGTGLVIGRSTRREAYLGSRRSLLLAEGSSAAEVR